MIDEKEYVGKTIEEARKTAISNGVDFRITMVNGEATMSTADLRSDRVNVSVVDGMVDGVHLG